MVVDYKATSKDGEVTLDAEWQDGYKRQMEVYQWLLRQNGLSVSDVGYFVYVNGRTDVDTFDGKLEFDIKVIPYTGSDSWVEGTLLKIKETLDQKEIPAAGKECDYCVYREFAGKKLRAQHLVQTGTQPASEKVKKVAKKKEPNSNQNETLFD